MGFGFRSSLIIGTLYGLVFFFVFLILELTGYADGSVYYYPLILLISLGGLFLQYLISPLIIGWIYRIEWIAPDRLMQEYPKIATFMENTARKYQINVPRFGIIREGTPNAFCYGWSKNSARLVVTDGILQYLDEKESLTVVGHEMGHIVHNDFIVMTFVSAIPVLFYTIFRLLTNSYRYGRIRSSGRDADKIEAVKVAIAVLSYIMYIVGYLLSLLISRIREYWADEFAAEETQNPNGLATALVKIAYGILQEPAKTQRQNDRSQFLRAMGIFDGRSAKQMAYTSTSANGKIDPNLIAKAAAWDLYQPWAKYYEIMSTHPLPAKRIRELSYMSYNKFKVPPAVDLSQAEVEFKKQMGSSALDEFLGEIIILLLPKITFFAWIILSVGLFWTDITTLTFTATILGLNFMAFTVLCFFVAGIFQLIQNGFKYSEKFQQHQITELIGTIKVSPIRPVPTITRGRVIGRGVPGLFWSEDLVINDGSGIMYIDYDFGIGIVNTLFGIFKADKLIGQDVEVVGWYRRGPSPYLQVHYIQLLTGGGNRFGNHKKGLWNFVAFFLIALGLGLCYLLI